MEFAVIDHLRSLRCMVAVVLHGSTTAAAAAIHVSQPAVTRAIIDLERGSGLRLFERAPRGMVPTDIGARVAMRARVMLQHLAKGVVEAAVYAPDCKPRPGGAERFANAVPASCLKALVAVAACASEVGAARHLGLSQPAVHRSLRAIEHLSGLPVFQTSPRGTRLTESGEALLRRTKLALSEARAIEGEFAAWRGTVQGRIVIGALPLSVGLVLPTAVDALLRQHPDVLISIVDGTYESLVQQLRSAEVDVVVGALRPDPVLPDIEQQVLLLDDLAVVARAGHAVFDRAGLQLQDLLAFDWIVPLSGTPASAALQRIFAAAGLPAPSAALQVSSPAMTRAMLLDTGRLALASHGQALRDERGGDIRVVPVPLVQTRRPIGFTVRGEGEPSPDLKALLTELHRAARVSAGA